MAKIKGTKKRDILNGFASADTLLGLDGNDDLKGNAGNDKLFGGKGNDKLLGGNGNDTLDGGLGNDTHNGGAGNDFLIAGVGKDTFIGGAGIDTVSYAASAVEVAIDLSTGVGSEGATGDIFSGIENITGGLHRIAVLGNDADNVLTGGAENDSLIGNGGNDTLIGGADRDYLVGGTGADSMDGGAGNDTADYTQSATGVSVDLSTGIGANGDAAGDTLVNIELVKGSQTGSDMITGNAADNTLEGFGGGDTLVGGSGNDKLYGGIGADSIDGGAGNDLLAAGDDTSMDTLIGGSGDDTVSYADVTGGAGVTVYLSSGATGGKSAGDTYSGIENVIGSQYDDLLRPAVGGIAEGQGGDDTISDTGGTEVLHGGAGNDVLTDDFFLSEDGLRDIFWLDLNTTGVDSVNGFDAGEDLIWIRLSELDFFAFLQISFENPGQTLLAPEQIINSATAAATIAGPQLIYDNDVADRTLWFDPDGTGAQAIREIATFYGFGGTLDRMDFFII